MELSTAKSVIISTTGRKLKISPELLEKAFMIESLSKKNIKLTVINPAKDKNKEYVKKAKWCL